MTILAQLFRLTWLVGLLIFGAFFLLLLGALLVWSVRNWWRLRRLGVPLEYTRFMSLRWRGLDAQAVAAAYWTGVNLGLHVGLEDWAGFATVGVDVLRLSEALSAAEKSGLQAGFGTLGAAALAGYDPLDVVHTAADRGLTAFTADDLSRLDAWGLRRQGRPR